jgi:poly(A) polymerase
VHDKSFTRWMPHINLLYPFLEDNGSVFEGAAEEIAQAIATIQPFQVEKPGTHS